jgi:hypothetical protein
MLRRITKVYAEGGLSELVWRCFLYAKNRLLRLAWPSFSYFYLNFARPVMPIRGKVVYSGVVVGHRRMGDSIVPKLYSPPQVESIPNYEETLVKALIANVRIGDRVVVIGGGNGVTSIIAAKLSKTKVICFEGDLAGVLATRKTAQLNDEQDKIDVIHAIVGANVAVYGNQFSEKIVSPADLPECDVLEMDCEGAEHQVLSEMKIRPRVVAVETHRVLGAPAEKVQQLLVACGYRVENLGLAEPRLQEYCIKNGVEVLVGILPN